MQFSRLTSQTKCHLYTQRYAELSKYFPAATDWHLFSPKVCVLRKTYCVTGTKEEHLTRTRGGRGGRGENSFGDLVSSWALRGKGNTFATN